MELNDVMSRAAQTTFPSALPEQYVLANILQDDCGNLLGLHVKLFGSVQSKMRTTIAREILEMQNTHLLLNCSEPPQ